MGFLKHMFERGFGYSHRGHGHHGRHDYGGRPVPEERQSGTGTLHCAGCGAVNRKDHSYCVDCGEKLSVGKARCNGCKAELPAGARYCPACGEKV